MARLPRLPADRSPPKSAPRVTRRDLLIGGGLGVGLIVAWAAWPRAYAPNLRAAPGEHIFGAFVKIGTDGHVTVIVPQVEMGQGVYTTLPQILADELGADWRTVSVEAAPPSPLYANTLFAEEWAADGWWPEGAIDRWARAEPLMITGGSTSARGFEARLREAGAAARALLCSAAAKRWDADWDACETADGFITRGNDKMRFGDVAAEAAALRLPDDIALREGTAHRLIARSLPRLDAPAKVDGSAQFAADIRLSDMVYASVTAGPLGDTRLKSVDRKAAMAVPGAIDLIEAERWVAGIGTNWWAASAALAAARPRFATVGPFASDRGIDHALDVAFDEGTRHVDVGDIATAFKGATLITAEYRLGLAPHAAPEPMSATAWLDKGELQLWIGTHAPGLAAAAAARAIGISADRVAVHPMFIGGSFGRRYEIEVAAQAAVLAEKVNRPVQLQWSRGEDLRQDRFRPAAAIRVAARLAPSRVDALSVKVAAPAPTLEMEARLLDGRDAHTAMAAQAGGTTPAAVAGAATPYAIPNVAIDHHPAKIGVPTGDWRGRAYGLTCFATEAFVDELAHLAGIEPFSFRMGMLSGNPRLAQCLSKVAALGGWNGGGPGSGQGLAAFAMAGSYIAVMAEAHIAENGRVKVDRLVAVADVGQVINPDIVRQQIGGGLIFGMSAATSHPLQVTRGLASPTRLGSLGLPRLADAPHVTVELVVSRAPSGGAGELAVPPVAPAIANALFARDGKRYRTLPLLAPIPATAPSI